MQPNHTVAERGRLRGASGLDVYPWGSARWPGSPLVLDESRRLTSIENAEALVNLQLSMAFLSTVILLRIQPGPDNMLVIARGIAQGRAVALFAVFWISAGAGIVQLPLVTFGVSSLVLASPVALKALQLAAVYWIWSGVRMFFSVPMANEVKNADRIMPLASS